MTIVDIVHIIWAIFCFIFVIYCCSNIKYIKKQLQVFHGSVLSDNAIKKLLKSGEIVISDIEEKDIQPASVDLKISNSFLKIESSTANIEGREESIEQTIYAINLINGH